MALSRGSSMVRNCIHVTEKPREKAAAARIGRPTTKFRLSSTRNLDLGFGGGEIAGDHCVLEAGSRVRAVTERLVLRLAAPAKPDHRPAAKAECLSRGIADLDIS